MIDSPEGDTKKSGSSIPAIGDRPLLSIFSDGAQKRKFITLWAVICFLVLGALSGSFWMRLRDRFVVSPGVSGTYSGAIEFVDGSQTPVLLEVGKSMLFGIVLSPGGVVHERSIARTEALVLDAQGESITLRGRRNEFDEFVGTAETSAKKRGHFTLGRRFDPRALTPEMEHDARSWVLLQAERAVWDEKISKIDAIKNVKLEDIERLKNFVTDKPRLRAGADAKYAQVAEQLQAARDQLIVRKEKAQRLAGSLALAQRVTPFGKLVTLARESNERELRWIESMLRVGDRVGPAGIDDEVRRGIEILNALAGIRREWNRIVELGGDPDA